MAPLIFVSDTTTVPNITRNFLSKDSAHPAGHPKRLMIDKEFSSVPAMMAMTRRALDQLLLSPRHDFTTGIGTASSVYVDEETGRFVETDRRLDGRQDMRDLGILQRSPEARRLHALMEAIGDLPVVTVLWADILHVASLNAVEFADERRLTPNMSAEAFAHDYPYGFLGQLKLVKPVFISAIHGSELLARQGREYGNGQFSRHPYFRDISPGAEIEEIVESLRPSLIASLERELSPARRYVHS